MAIGYISHHDCMLHDMGHHHSEQPARLSAINDRLIASGLEFVLRQYDAPLVERVKLEAVHDADYIDEIEAASPAEGVAWVDGDTAMNKHSLTAARRTTWRRPCSSACETHLTNPARSRTFGACAKPAEMDQVR